MSDQSNPSRLETPAIWTLALLPIVPLLLYFGPAPLPLQGERPPGAPVGVGHVIRDVLLYVVYLGGLVLAYRDARQLKAAGFVRPFGWLWALIGGGVYVIGRCIVVDRRNGGARRPMWVWIILAALYLVLGLVTPL